MVDDLTTLALAGRDGDRVSLAAFVRAAQPDVWRLCAHLVGRDEADDVTQDTLLRALRALPAYRGEASARTWVLSIARRCAADAIRRARRRARLRPGPAGVRAGPDEHVGVVELLAGLEPDRRAAFVLTQLLGLTYAEAAQACGCEIGTIRSRVARARAELVHSVAEASG